VNPSKVRELVAGAACSSESEAALMMSSQWVQKTGETALWYAGITKPLETASHYM